MEKVLPARMLNSPGRKVSSGDGGLGSLEGRTRPWVPSLPTEVWHEEDK